MLLIFEQATQNAGSVHGRHIAGQFGRQNAHVGVAVAEQRCHEWHDRRRAVAWSASMAVPRLAGILRTKVGQQRQDARLVADPHQRRHNRFAHP